MVSFVKASEGATKLADVDRDVNDVLAQQKAEKRFFFLERRPKRWFAAKTDLEAICALS